MGAALSAACSTAAGTPTTLVDRRDRRRAAWRARAAVPEGPRRTERGLGGGRRRRRGRCGEAGRCRRDPRDRGARARRSETLVLSIAAGVTIAALEALVPGRPVVRAMPNTPALVGVGASVIAAGTNATGEHLDIAERLLGAVGIVVRVGEPAARRGHRPVGLGPGVHLPGRRSDDRSGRARRVAPRRRDATRRCRRCSDRPRCSRSDERGPEALRAAVTSPGGTTAAGLRELEQHGFRAAILDAVAAATRRSRELGTSG